MTEQRSTVAGVTVVKATPDQSSLREDSTRMVGFSPEPERTGGGAQLAAQTAWQLVYAPGAGSSIDDPFGTYASEKLAARGVPVARFQFPYQEAGSRRPDRPNVLEATWLSVIEACRIDGTKLVIGGRSMGGRVASLVVAGGASVDGLVAFAYPLHQPGHPERARVGHLASIGVPTLFCSGTRDAFGTPEELPEAANSGPESKLHLMDGADHGFAVLKRSGRTREEVYDEAVTALVDWVAHWLEGRGGSA